MWIQRDAHSLVDTQRCAPPQTCKYRDRPMQTETQKYVDTHIRVIYIHIVKYPLYSLVPVDLYFPVY